MAALIGTAKPMDCASSEISVLMPTTTPQRSTSGPPELPGLIGASVWIIGSSEMPGSSRLSPLTIPRVIVCSRPIGLPMATTSSPTLTADESPSRAAGSAAALSTRSSATSSTESSPRMRAGVLLPESRVTDSEAAPSTTCALVRIWPSFSMITPEPTIVSKRRCGFALLIFIAWIETTAGETRSKTTASGSAHDCAAATVGRRSVASSASPSRIEPG